MADNPYFIQPANPLAALMTGVQGYDRGQRGLKEQELKAGRQSALERLQAGDMRGAIAQTLSVGDTDGAKAIATFAHHQATEAAANAAREQSRAQFAQTHGLAQQQFGLQQQIAARKDTPEKVRILQDAGIDPRSPEGRQALFKLDEKLTPTDRKQIFEAEDENAKITDTVAALTRAKELNPKTFTGITAGPRGYIGTAVPGAGAVLDKGAAEATREFGQVMSGEAIKTMAATLKGATTDFELRKFEQMLADPSTPPEIRGRVIDRMLTLANRQMQINQKRMDQLRGGSYYKPGGGQSPTTQPQGAQNDRPEISDARMAIGRGAPRERVEERLRQMKIPFKPSDLDL